MNLSGISLLLLRLAISYIWLTAGISKLLNPSFISHFPSTIEQFAKDTHFTCYSSFLKEQVLPNAQIFAQLTIWGEILTGVAFLLGFPLFIAAIIGIFMNVNYFLVATTVPSQFVNILLIFSQLAAYANNAGNTWGMSASLKKK